MIGGTQEVKFKLKLPEDIPNDVIDIAKTNLVNSFIEYVKNEEAKKLFDKAEGMIKEKVAIVESNLPPKSDVIIPKNGKISS